MDFKEWWDVTPMPDVETEATSRALYFLSKKLAELAWVEQQKKIDKLKLHVKVLLEDAEGE